MNIRKSIVSKSKQDFACSLFLFSIIPVIFFYEVQTIFTTIHGDSGFFYFNLVCATFLVFNIIGNLLSIILIDTSVFTSDEVMTVTKFKKDPTAKHWNLCDKCELVVPPRSWHCDTCGMCMLKRDHHCMFASNCVGYRNHRHFLMFLAHFFIGTTYAVIYNSYFIWVVNSTLYARWTTLIKMALPMFMVFYGGREELHLLFYMLILIGSCLSGVLLIYHGKLVIRNALTHEKNKGAYDLGTAANLKLIFGSKWPMTLVWPFIESPMPKVYWMPSESNKGK